MVEVHGRHRPIVGVSEDAGNFVLNLRRPGSALVRRQLGLLCLVCVSELLLFFRGARIRVRHLGHLQVDILFRVYQFIFQLFVLNELLDEAARVLFRNRVFRGRGLILLDGTLFGL